MLEAPPYLKAYQIKNNYRHGNFSVNSVFSINPGKFEQAIEAGNRVPPEISLFKEAVVVAIQDIEQYLKTGIQTPKLADTISFVYQVTEYPYICKGIPMTDRKK